MKNTIYYVVYKSDETDKYAIEKCTEEELMNGKKINGSVHGKCPTEESAKRRIEDLITHGYV